MGGRPKTWLQPWPPNALWVRFWFRPKLNGIITHHSSFLGGSYLNARVGISPFRNKKVAESAAFQDAYNTSGSTINSQTRILNNTPGTLGGVFSSMVGYSGDLTAILNPIIERKSLILMGIFEPPPAYLRGEKLNKRLTPLFCHNCTKEWLWEK